MNHLELATKAKSYVQYTFQVINLGGKPLSEQQLAQRIVDEATSHEAGFSFMRYYEGEQKIVSPALFKAGFARVGNWVTVDGDSFGPMTRVCELIAPSGKRCKVWYG